MSRGVFIDHDCARGFWGEGPFSLYVIPEDEVIHTDIVGVWYRPEAGDIWEWLRAQGSGIDTSEATQSFCCFSETGTFVGLVLGTFALHEVERIVSRKRTD